MNKLVLVVLLLTVLQATYCTPVEQNRDFESLVNERIQQEWMEGNQYIFNDTYIVEGDILLTPMQAAIYKESGWNGIVKSASWEKKLPWRRYIPYMYVETLPIPPQQGPPPINVIKKPIIENAIKNIQKLTCLRFTKWMKKEKDYIQFGSDPQRCFSSIGRVGGGQLISIGENCDGLVTVHEIMHALGRFHEHTRPDRDKYVTINWNNINQDPRMKDQFLINPLSDTLSLPYDYISLMHYDKEFLSIRPGRPTMTPTNPQAVMGQVNMMSMYDIQHINIKYCPERSIRLVGGVSKGIHDGRIEVYWKGRWGTACDKGFDLNDGVVICNYLGFPGVLQINFRALHGQGKGPIWVDNFHCTGNEATPFDCMTLTDPKGGGTCNNHRRDAGLYCSPNVRLVSGGSKHGGTEGRVEVYIPGQGWGTVCRNQFDANEAKVICRQLGHPYKSAEVVKLTSTFALPYQKRSQVKILMSELQCKGNEYQLLNCQRLDYYEHQCTHTNDVAIKCK